MAQHSWSGQDVGLPLQLMPLRRAITSSYFIPFTSLLMPWRLPLQPPKNFTSTILPSSPVNSMNRAQVPTVCYVMVFICCLCYYCSVYKSLVTADVPHCNSRDCIAWCFVGQTRRSAPTAGAFTPPSLRFACATSSMNRGGLKFLYFTFPFHLLVSAPTELALSKLFNLSSI